MGIIGITNGISGLVTSSTVAAAAATQKEWQMVEQTAKPLSKAARIREYQAANPGARPSAVVQTLKGEYPTINESYVRTVRSNEKKRARAVAPAAKKEPKTKKGHKPQRPFPSVNLEEVIAIPQKIKELNGGNPWPPSEVARALEISPKTTRFFYLTAGSRDYGLTEGTRYSKQISLAPIGRALAYAPSREVESESLQQALFNVTIFKDVFEHYKGSTLPELKYLANTLESQFKLPPPFHEDFHRIFQANCRYVQKYGEIASPAAREKLEPGQAAERILTLATPAEKAGLRAFVILPFREKSDRWPKGFFSEVLNNLITPAVVEAGFTVETAKNEGSDVIQATIVNALLSADLVIADLTDHNPNVLFELGVRMAGDKPVALIRAAGTPAIFDVDNMLRVLDYNPNLWKSTLEQDIPALTAHVKGAWENRKTAKTYMQILKEH